MCTLLYCGSWSELLPSAEVPEMFAAVPLEFIGDLEILTRGLICLRCGQ